MSDSFEPRDDLTERLAALGRQPVAPSVQSRHLTAMSSVAAPRSFRTSLAGRLKVGAGVLVGFLLGASGLTAAGAMGPLQPIAAQVASEVANVEGPQGPKDKAAKAAKAKAAKAAKARLEDGSIGTVRDWSDGCATVEGASTFAGNRGLYLKQERAKGADALAAAKASTCGLPVGAEQDTEAPEVESEDETKKDDAGDAGKAGEEHGKATAPGQQDKGEPGDKAQGPKDDAGAQGTEHKRETPAGPPADGAGASGITPPVEDPESETPATPDTPNADTPAGDDSSSTEGEV